MTLSAPAWGLSLQNNTCCGNSDEKAFARVVVTRTARSPRRVSCRPLAAVPTLDTPFYQLLMNETVTFECPHTSHLMYDNKPLINFCHIKNAMFVKKLQALKKTKSYLIILTQEQLKCTYIKFILNKHIKVPTGLQCI